MIGPHVDAATGPGHRDPGFLATWKPLRFLNLYRLTLSGLFVALVFSGTGPDLLGGDNLPLFKGASLAYLAGAVISSFAIRGQWFPFRAQLFGQLLLDIVAIILLMHASGGVTSGLGLLLVVAVTGASLLVMRRTALLFAAVAAFAVLGEQIYSQLNHVFPQTYYTHAGILGATLFAAALVGNLLATRVTESEALAKQRGVDLANMEQLNEYIIQHMQTGILVVDGSNVVRLVNDSAWHLLNAPAAIVGRPVRTVSEELAQELESWQEDTDVEPQTFRSSPTSPEIQPRFARLGRDHAAGVLVFLEDTSAMAQRAQQMKLASLGRLTASIAHEIRNPLGAISHASQLLAESGSVEPSSQRMTQIIHQHTQRMNRIIENILQLSRRDRARPELFDLKDWLEEFVQEFARSETVDPEAIAVEISPPDVQVRMDPSQLHQVLWNLCKNGLRHSRAYPRNPQVELRGGMTIESNVPLLDVIDHGEGIAPDVAQQIFDPFFTTANRGVGLGLYIARELCEGNQARLNYVPVPTGGSCFRITFADPRRRQQQVA